MDDLKTVMLDAITLPVRAAKTAVYSTVVDAEDRLIAFIGMSLQSDAVASLIAASLNDRARPRSFAYLYERHAEGIASEAEKMQAENAAGVDTSEKPQGEKQ